MEVLMSNSSPSEEALPIGSYHEVIGVAERVTIQIEGQPPATVGTDEEKLIAGLRWLRDVLRVCHHADQEAARRLAKGWLSRSQVFYVQRWVHLETHVKDRYGSWEEMLAQNLLLACSGLPPLPLSQLYPEVRRRLRAEIERDLYDGLTLYQVQSRGEVDLSELEGLAAAVEGKDIPASLTPQDWELVEKLKSALTPKELEACCSEASDPASKMARSRARKKAKKLLQQQAGQG